MKDVITLGEAMVVFNPVRTGPMKFVNNFERNIGGAELNVMLGCARLGLKTGYISRLGHDEFGKYIRNFARGEGIDVNETKLVEGYPTSINFKEISEDGSVRTFYYRNQSPTLSMDKSDLNEDYIKQSKILHITGIFPAIHDQNLDLMYEVIRLAKKHDVKVALDPNIRLKLWTKQQASDIIKSILPDVDLLLAGDEEMDIVLGERDPRKVIELCEPYGIDYIVLKKGDKGSVGYYNGEFVEADAVEPGQIVDTVGAGDGFDVGFLYSYLQGWSLEKSLHFANTIGSMVVSVKGDNEGLPDLEDIQMKLGEIERIER